RLGGRRPAAPRAAARGDLEMSSAGGRMACVRTGPVCMLVAAALLGACAALAPTDELTWSRPLAKTLPVQQGEAVEVAAFSRQAPGAFLGEWEQWAILPGNMPTDYRLVERDSVVVLDSYSAEGGSALSRNIHIDPRRHPIIEF